MGSMVYQEPTFTAAGAIPPYSRVKLNGSGKVEVCGDSDGGVGTTNARTHADGDLVSVTPRLVPGARMMTAGGVFAKYTPVYAAANGRVSSVANGIFEGIAMEAATAAGDQVQVLPALGVGDSLAALGALDGLVVYDDDFAGISSVWTEVETNGLGVVASKGQAVLAFDAVAEAATASLYQAGLPVNAHKSPVVEFLVSIDDLGDDAALDINIGLASSSHATDFDTAAQYVAFHLDGNSADLKAQSKDGTTTVNATDTLVNIVLGEQLNLRIDATDAEDVKLFVNGARVLGSTTFRLDGYVAGDLTPIVHVEKTSNDTTAQVSVDRIRFQQLR